MIAQLKEKDPSICPVNFLSESDIVSLGFMALEIE